MYTINKITKTLTIATGSETIGTSASGQTVINFYNPADGVGFRWTSAGPEDVEIVNYH